MGAFVCGVGISFRGIVSVHMGVLVSDTGRLKAELTGLRSATKEAWG